jgi:hypothetical protein
MFALPLLRDFGLLILIAPCYRPNRKRKRPRPRPRLECPPVSGDLLLDARELLESGNIVAAAMAARVEIERQLTTLALMRPDFGSEWLGIWSTAVWLKTHHMIKRRTLEHVLEANAVGNCAAHGKAVTKEEVSRMFSCIDSLRATVTRKGGAA